MQSNGFTTYCNYFVQLTPDRFSTLLPFGYSYKYLDNIIYNTVLPPKEEKVKSNRAGRNKVKKKKMKKLGALQKKVTNLKNYASSMQKHLRG